MTGFQTEEPLMLKALGISDIIRSTKSNNLWGQKFYLLMCHFFFHKKERVYVIYTLHNYTAVCVDVWVGERTNRLEQ